MAGAPDPRLVLATGNAGKVRELRALLGPAWELRLQSAFGVHPVPETGATFLDNALLKARHAARLTGWPALADDSGLEVDALGGAPGVHSARYAGEGATDAENNRRLLAELAGVPTARRTARFRCVLAFVRDVDDPDPLTAVGVWEGLILDAPRGSGGFGYDPLFWVPALGRTSAELEADEKNRHSHRGQALSRLAAVLSRAGFPAT